MTRIVGLLGFQSSGKDTASQPLIAQGFVPMSFADAMKDSAAMIFGWDRSLLEGITDESRRWREEVDPWWAARLDVPHLTPRWVLQNFGTLMREHFHPDIWTANVERRIELAGDAPVVLRDLRFPNELEIGRQGVLIRIRRGPDPIWLDTALRALDGDHVAHRLMHEYYKVHPSEWVWLNEPVDYIIENDFTILALHEKMRVLFPPDAGKEMHQQAEDNTDAEHPVLVPTATGVRRGATQMMGGIIGGVGRLIKAHR
jgi:hypothetical protein